MRVFRRKGVAVVMAFVAVVLIGGAVSASIPGPNGLISGGTLNPIGNITGYPRTVRGSFGIRF